MPIPYHILAPLRLQSFLPLDCPVVEKRAFEWMGGLWLYEGIGFTWFGRIEVEPDITAGLELYFEELPRLGLAKIFAALQIALAPGMACEELQQVLGPISQTKIFVADRRTFVFRVGDPDIYEVGCTVHGEHGLIHLSMIRNDVRRRLAVA